MTLNGREIVGKSKQKQTRLSRRSAMLKEWGILFHSCLRRKARNGAELDSGIYGRVCCLCWIRVERRFLNFHIIQKCHLKNRLKSFIWAFVNSDVAKLLFLGSDRG